MVKISKNNVGCQFPRLEPSLFPYLYGKLSLNPKYSLGMDFDREIQYLGN